MKKKLQKGILLIETILSKDTGQDLPILKELLKMFDVLKEEIIIQGNTPKEEFLKALLSSKYRFIHVSAHGEKGVLYIHGNRNTPVSENDIQNYLKKHNLDKPLKQKFLTISACGELSAEFIKMLNQITGVAATIYPLTTINFEDSALFMSVFYYSLLKHPAMNENIKTSMRITHFIDAFQKAKTAYLQLGGVGCFRLDYWWGEEHIYIF